MPDIAAIAVDNKELTFAKAFDMTKGNSNKNFLWPVSGILSGGGDFAFCQLLFAGNVRGKLGGKIAHFHTACGFDTAKCTG